MVRTLPRARVIARHSHTHGERPIQTSPSRVADLERDRMQVDRWPPCPWEAQGHTCSTKAEHNTGTHDHAHTQKTPEADRGSPNSTDPVRLLGLLKGTEKVCMDIGVHR